MREILTNKEFDCIRKSVAGKRVLVVSRFRRRNMSSVYEIIGYYIGSILESCGAKVTHKYLSHSGSRFEVNSRYDIGIVCYFDTDLMVNKVQRALKSVQSLCKKTFYYSNAVPYISGFNHYFVSLHHYTSPDCFIYRKPPYSLKHALRRRNLPRSSWVGRGADHSLFTPQQKQFQVMIDAFRGPTSKSIIRTCVGIADVLEEARIPIVRLGFRPNYRPTNKLSFKRIANIYNQSSIYISGIGGLYELPVIETQCAGNYVISYRGKLHNELLCDDSSFECHDEQSVLEKVLELRGKTDPSIPRDYIMQNHRWGQVVLRMVKHF